MVTNLGSPGPLGVPADQNALTTTPAGDRGLGVLLVIVALLSAVMLPWSVLVAPSILALIGALLAAACATTVTPRRPSTSPWGQPATLILIWAFTAACCICWLHVTAPDTGVHLLDWLSFPIRRYSVRSILDVVSVTGIAIGFGRLASRVTRRSAAPSRATLGVCLVAWVAAVLLLKPGTAKDGIRLWAEQIGDGEKALLLFDLANFVWLTAALPLSILRSDPSWNQLTNGASSERWGTAIPWILAPVLVGVVLQGTVAGWETGFDALPAPWWARKAILSLFWAGLAEEVIFRGVALSVIFGALRGVPEPRRAYFAIGLMSLVFAGAHLNLSWTSVVLALAVGIANGVVVLRLGSLLPCVLNHTAANTLLGRFN